MVGEHSGATGEGVLLLAVCQDLPTSVREGSVTRTPLVGVGSMGHVLYAPGRAITSGSGGRVLPEKKSPGSYIEVFEGNTLTHKILGISETPHRRLMASPELAAHLGPHGHSARRSPRNTVGDLNKLASEQTTTPSLTSRWQPQSLMIDLCLSPLYLTTEA